MKTITLHLTELETCAILAGLKALARNLHAHPEINLVDQELQAGWSAQERIASHDFKVAILDEAAPPGCALVASTQNIVTRQGHQVFGEFTTR